MNAGIRLRKSAGAVCLKPVGCPRSACGSRRHAIGAAFRGAGKINAMQVFGKSAGRTAGCGVSAGWEKDYNGNIRPAHNAGMSRQNGMPEYGKTEPKIGAGNRTSAGFGKEADIMVFVRDMNYTPKSENRRLHIYLPDEYDQTNERYSVMYYFDGHNLFYDSWATYGKSWGLKEFLDQWDKRMIIVGMECGHCGDERLDEYSPYTMTMLGKNIHGMGEETLQWIRDDIKPMIDGEFRTWPQREATGIAGSSMGGLMAVYAGIVYNETFSKMACLSPAVDSCRKELNRDLRAHTLNPDSRFYLSLGTEEAGKSYRSRKTGELLPPPSVRYLYELSGRLQKKGAMTDVYIQEGGRHCEADWEKQNRRYMEFLWM